MDLASALDDLARHEPGLLPAEAMRWLRGNPEIGVPALLADVERAIAEPTVDRNLGERVFFGAYILGDLRETRAHEPVCRLLRQGDKAENLFGDGISESITTILVRTFDGHADRLQSLVQDEKADEYARATGLVALKVLTALGRIPEIEMAHFLRALPGRLGRRTNFVWAEWAIIAGQFGLTDLRPWVEKAMTRKWAPPAITDLEHFDKDIAEAEAEPDLARRFARDLDRLHEDSVEHLSMWHSFSEAYRKELANPKPRRPVLEGLGGPAFRGTEATPSRHVGRNDPCPCGSGKKYKKCCIDKPSAAA